MTMKFILTGVYAGKSMKINHVDFVNGEAVVKGDLAKMGGLITYLSTFNAFPLGSDELNAALERDRKNKGEADGSGEVLDGAGESPSGVQPNEPTPGSTGSDGSDGASDDGAGDVPEGDGIPEGSVADTGAANVASDPETLKIIDAIKSLDPAKDDFWTGQGLPTVDAVAQASGVANVTRKKISEAIPNFNREAALAANQI
jgi:hypothetical protein